MIPIISIPIIARNNPIPAPIPSFKLFGIELIIHARIGVKDIIKNKNLRRDVKSILQEWTQANGLGLPVYKVLKKNGLDHQPTFEIELKVKDFDVILGNGRSLQIAQKKTAEKFIKKFIREDIIVR